MTELAVLGSPIAHSKSPLLHAAAYTALGLDWHYSAAEVTGDRLAEFVASRDSEWRGLSLTMPLKRDVLPLLDWRDPLVDIVGGANTLLFDRSAGGDAVLRGFNTDVYGVTEAFAAAGVDRLDFVQVLGGGATAASVIVAVRELAATRILVSVRDPAKASDLVRLGAEIGADVTVRPLGDPPAGLPDAVVSTIPGHGDHGLEFSDEVRGGSVLFDVAYDPWPSTFATAWLDARGTVISGLEMLLHQALAQVRVFVNGTPHAELHDEPRVLAAMRASLAVGG